MFKNTFYKIAVMAVLSLPICSCNKYLDLHPQNGITSDKFWQTKEQLQTAVIGIYATMRTGPAADFFEWGEARADFVAPGPGISVDENSIINTSILPTNGIVDWSPFYQIISLCNNVIDNAPGVITRDHTLTQDVLNSSLGEARAIRALMYFYLVRSFGDVPLLLKYTDSDNDLQQLAKTPQKDVLTQIVADLKAAETLAVPSYGNNVYDKGRITSFTVYTIEADVYLWMDDYADCITACDNVINSNKFALVPGDANWFKTLYNTGNSVEGIFEIQFDAQAINPYYNYFSTTKGVNTKYLANPQVIDQFYTTDPLVATNADIRGIDVAVHVADQSIPKYVETSINTFITASTNSYAHWIMYRYADVLLMKAEACIYSNRGQDALDLINQIRTRAHALPSSAQNPNVDDIDGLTNYLVAERAREFAYEGKRWYDLLRNAKRNNFARMDLLRDAASLSVPPIYLQSALSKLNDVNSLYFPIPLSEIQLDPNLVQNPFYK